MNTWVQLSAFESLSDATYIKGGNNHPSTCPEVCFHGESKFYEIDNKDEQSYLSRVHPLECCL